MSDLSFEIVSAHSMRDVIAPALAFDVRITTSAPAQPVHAILLRCQILVEAASRRNSSLTWTSTTASIPGFSGSTIHPIVVPCALHSSLATAEYFQSVEDLEVPLAFLLSGSVFLEGAQGGLQVCPIPSDTQVRFNLDLRQWHSLMDLHYARLACLNLRRDVFEELCRFKNTQGFSTFEEAIQVMLSLAEQKRTATSAGLDR